MDLKEKERQDKLNEIIDWSQMYDKIEAALEYIKDNGNYAMAYGDGKILDEDVDIIRLAYTDDDLYDYLTDAVAEYYLANSNLIVYDKNKNVDH